MMKQNSTKAQNIITSHNHVEKIYGDIILAVSTQHHSFPNKFNWLAENRFGMEYGPNPKNLNLIRTHLEPYLKKNIPIRHHGYFPGYELGDMDEEKAKVALSLHMKAVDAIEGIGEQVMTVHMGLAPNFELDHARVKENLTKLVEYSKKKGIHICLENLRKGPTSNPEIVLEWAETCGANITMDIGHAVSSKRVILGELNVPNIVKMFSHKLLEVHFYESETDTHHAPKDMIILAPIVDQLLKTRCKWWTIELNKYDEILHTRNLIRDYVASKSQQLAA